MKDTETLIIQALASINGVKYASATEAAEGCLADRQRRPCLLRRAVMPAPITLLDFWSRAVPSDRLTATDISAMKYKALVTADPKIRPIRSSKNGRHYFILYVDPRCFRDLKTETSSPIVQAQREVSLELENDRLFQGGDLLWDGVIIKEVHEMFSELGTPFTNVGDCSTAEVGCAFLCGAQAVAALMPSGGSPRRKISTTAISTASKSLRSTASAR